MRRKKLCETYQNQLTLNGVTGFTFNDNLSLTPEAIQKKKDAAPVGTKLYKNKILGLRGRATGIVFVNFDSKRHVLSKSFVKNTVTFQRFTAGLDTAYSASSPDTIAMIFQGDIR